MRIQLWHQSHSILLDYPRRLVAVLVVFKSMLRRQAAHADIHAWLGWIAFRIGPQNGGMACRLRIQQDDIDVVMESFGQRAARWLVLVIVQLQLVEHSLGRTLADY